MTDLLSSTTSYLDFTLGKVGTAVPWLAGKKLPAYLRERYEFRRTTVGGVDCLLMLQQGDNLETPAILRKHMEAVYRVYRGPVVYVTEAVSAYERQRLIQQRVPFVVPGKQMYLPPLGIDLREQFAPARKKPKQLGAVAQVLVLREIMQPGFCSAPSGHLAKRLGYSAMTLARATAELAEFDLTRNERVGRKKHTVFLYRGKALWNIAGKFLRNPVQKRTRVEGNTSALSAPAAGESALAHYTLLAEPKGFTVAVHARDWPERKEHLCLEEVPERWDEGVAVELWRYNPRLLEDEPWVDRLSLWLSLRDIRDERIEKAMDELLVGVSWLED